MFGEYHLKLSSGDEQYFIISYAKIDDEISKKRIKEFKLAIECGAEIEFQWKGIHFGMVRYGIDNKITAYLWNQSDTAQAFDSADDALEYMVGGDRLRDVITRVTVLSRTM